MVKKKRPLLSSIVCGTVLGVALLCRPYTTAWIAISMGMAAIVMRKQLSICLIVLPSFHPNFNLTSAFNICCNIGGWMNIDLSGEDMDAD